MKHHPVCPKPARVNGLFEARLEWNVVHFNICISDLGFPADLGISLVVPLPCEGGRGGCGWWLVVMVFVVIDGVNLGAMFF